MTLKRNQTAQAAVGDTEAGCRLAHKLIDAYAEWAGYDDMRRMNEWRAWASGRILAGWTPEAVAERFKDAWGEHCREIGRRPKGDTSRDAASVRRLILGIQERIREPGSDFLLLEPWWERVNQQPSPGGYATIARNRAALGLPPGPPWTIPADRPGAEVVNHYWSFVPDE